MSRVLAVRFELHAARGIRTKNSRGQSIDLNGFLLQRSSKRPHQTNHAELRGGIQRRNGKGIQPGIGSSADNGSFGCCRPMASPSVLLEIMDGQLHSCSASSALLTSHRMLHVCSLTVYRSCQINIKSAQVRFRWLLFINNELSFPGDAGIGHDHIDSTLLLENLLEDRGQLVPVRDIGFLERKTCVWKLR